jgi:hypothetical protein
MGSVSFKMKLHCFTIYYNFDVNVRITFPHTVYQTMHQISPNLFFSLKYIKKDEELFVKARKRRSDLFSFEHAFEMAC